MICVAEITLKLKAETATPLNSTALTPRKFVPVMTTGEKAAPLAGKMPVIVGAAGAVTVKLVALVAAPAGVTMLMGPEVRPPGRLLIVNAVGEFTVKLVTRTPLMSTALAPVKLSPAMTMLDPMPPLPGVKPVMVGAGDAVTVKLAPLVATPPDEITLIGPVPAPLGTLNTVICVDEFTVKIEVATPLKVMRLTPTKFEPVIITWEPGAPAVGVKPEIVGAGAGVTVKLPALVAMPPGVTTLMRPVVAPPGTEPESSVGDALKKDAVTPLKSTCVTPVKSVP